MATSIALPATRPAATPSPWAGLPVVIAGAFMVVLDFFIGNVALPSIAADLNAGHSALEWVVASYGLSVAALLILAGRIGDAYGRRATYAAGLALFTVASIGCGLAPSATALIGARILQGVAGALIMPQVLAIISTTFQGEDRIKAMGIYSGALGLAAVGGQLLGGLLVHADVAGLGWRSVFLVNVPIGIVALVLTFRLVRESRPATDARLDLTGAALVTGAVVALVLPLIEGRAAGWPAWTWLSLAASVALAAGFVAHQRRRARTDRPALLDLTLFADRTFSAGLVTQILFWCGQAAFFVYLALYLQNGRGLDALDAGLVFTIVAVTYVVACGAAASLTEVHGRRVAVAGGLGLAAGHGALVLAVGEVGTGGSLWALVPGLALVGLGMGLALTALTTITLADLREEDAGAGSGVMATVQELGNAVGVAITGVLFFGLLDGGHGAGEAFRAGAVEFTAVGLAIAALALLLPKPGRTPRPTGAR